MVRDDFDRLMDLFTQAEEGKPVSIDKAIGEALNLFENIRTNMEKASPDEKQQIIEEMNAMCQTLTEETKKVTTKTGMTEDQILASVDSHHLYTQEQWETLQDAKQKLFKSGSLIKKMMQPPKPKLPMKEGGGKVHKTRRSDWMKS